MRAEIIKDMELVLVPNHDQFPALQLGTNQLALVQVREPSKSMKSGNILWLRNGQAAYRVGWSGPPECHAVPLCETIITQKYLMGMSLDREGVAAPGRGHQLLTRSGLVFARGL
ncbi:hypothetical protein [Brevundimonas vesicularis]|uniref:hypothetical protein n=1 Tax=Brevundimonas vesicularis TaxID=41276 RepID=UPI0038D43A25